MPPGPCHSGSYVGRTVDSEQLSFRLSGETARQRLSLSALTRVVFILNRLDRGRESIFHGEILRLYRRPRRTFQNLSTEWADPLLYFGGYLALSARSYVGGHATFTDVAPKPRTSWPKRMKAVQRRRRPLWPDIGLWPARSMIVSRTQRPEARDYAESRQPAST